MAVEGIGAGKVVPIELLRQQRAEAAREKVTAAPQRPAASQKPAAGEREDQARRAREPRARVDSGNAARTREPSAPVDRAGLMAEIKSDLEELPDVRKDKVIEAKLRISTGYYDRPEVKKRILQSFLGSILGGGSDSPDES